MYRLIFLALLPAMTQLLSAQESGRILFEEKMDLHMTLPPDRQHFKEMIPQYNSSNYEFLFAGDESIYRPWKDPEIAEETMGGPGSGMRMRFGRENRVVYKNLDKETMIDSRDFLQKQFLITGAPTPRKWKVGTKQKEILGYGCMSAHFQADSATTITAWFTPQLQPSNGPSDYQGLPGMILQIDINNGWRTITAVEIQLDEIDTAAITAPKKGQKVTAEEFEKIREEKMKEMGMQQGGPSGGPMMRQIIINH